jgi:glycine oxidase
LQGIEHLIPNTMSETKSYLIVGGGVAGISVAVHLIRNGHDVTLLDSGVNVSSSIAAGQINPMVFRRMSKSWRIDEFLPKAQQFYAQLELETGATFYTKMTIRRLFSSEQEREMWFDKQNVEEYSPYLEQISPEDTNFSLVKNQFGSGRVKQSAYVSADSFLGASKKWVQERGTLLLGSVRYADIDPSNSSYKGTSYNGIIFCQGYQNHENPWFAKYQVNSTKGEILTVESKTLPAGESLNRKCFLLPIAPNRFRLGATYVWNTADTLPTVEGKQELLEAVKVMTESPFEIIDQLAGIRPTTYDRRPIIGTHHAHLNLHVFNGLGAKGYLIAPFMAQEFVAYLEGKGELDREVRLERYNKA